MLTLPDPPDFQALAAFARGLDFAGHDPLQSGMDRRQMPRRDVAAAVYLGIVPPPCERLRLSRIPVTVFKPTSGGWAVNLSPAGLALIAADAVELRERLWVRLDTLAVRPTILPGRIEACDPLELDPDAPGGTRYLLRLRFLHDDPGVAARLGFLPRPPRSQTHAA